MANKRIKQIKVSEEKLFKGLNDFQFETRNFKLSESVVHPGVQKRVQGVNPTLGAVPDDVEHFREMLDNGTVTLDGLIRRDPLIICGVLDDTGAVVQYARVDGHTRIPAMIAFGGTDLEMPVQYFQATERELIFAASQANAQHGNRLTPSDIRSMVWTFLEDVTFATLSDTAIFDYLMGATKNKRNIGNWRRDLVKKHTLELMRKMDDADLSIILRQQIEKYMPPIRTDIHGNTINTGEIGGNAFDNLYADDSFAKYRPVEVETETVNTPVTSTPATTGDAPAEPIKPAGSNFVKPVGDLDEVSSPVTDDAGSDADTDADSAPAAVDFGYDYDGEGQLFQAENVEFQTSATYGTVEIVTQTHRIVVSISALEAFVDAYRQSLQTGELYQIDSN